MRCPTTELVDAMSLHCSTGLLSHRKLGWLMVRVVQRRGPRGNPMRFKLIYGLMLVLPLSAYTACSSDDDDNNGGASGMGGASHAGSSGHAGTAGRGGAGGRGGMAGSEIEAGSGGDFGSGAMGGEAGQSAGEAGGMGGEGGEAGAVALLSDAQVIKVVTTANDGEIAAAQVALPAAHVAAVATFAQMMVTDHSMANQQTLALVSTKHIPPERSDVSDKLQDDAAALLVKLSSTPSASFDATYMQSQLQMHQDVLNLIDHQLLPSATDADLKALLTTTRATVEAHLTQAETVNAGL